MKTISCLLLSLVLLSACKTTAPGRDVPARLLASTAESRAELRATVASALNSKDVLLADDALTHSSVLIIEPGPHGSMAQPPLKGRILSPPERFQLFFNNGQCILVHGKSSKRWVLKRSQCIAE